MGCDGLTLCNPVYWLGGLIIFGAGLWVGRVVALRTMSPRTSRTVAAMALIVAGVLGLVPAPTPSSSAVQNVPNSPLPLPARGLPDPTVVMVAGHSVPAGTKLTSNDVAAREVARVPPGISASLEDVVGMTTTADLADREQIPLNWLASPPGLARVVVARTALSMESVLTVYNVELREVFLDDVLPDAATHLADVRGRVLLGPVTAREEIRMHWLSSALPSLPTVAPGMPQG